MFIGDVSNEDDDNGDVGRSPLPLIDMRSLARSSFSRFMRAISSSTDSRTWY